MAKTSAEKMRDYRQRQKEKGGKELKIQMTSEDVIFLTKLQEQNWPMPGMDITGITKALINHSLKRVIAIYQRQLELVSLGMSDEIITAYLDNERSRWKPLTVEEFLTQRG